jgi:D-lactate dehydrogenase
MLRRLSISAWRRRTPGWSALSVIHTTGSHESSASGNYSFRVVLAAGAAGAVGGFAAGDHDARLRRMVLPSSYPSCCEAALSDAQKALPEKLGEIVGKTHVKVNYTQKGSRLGKGTALAYVQPGTMREAIDALQACVKADVAVLPQGANSGLTGGSVPRNDQVGRPTVVIQLRRLKKILPIGDRAHQVLCFAGAGIYDLNQLLAQRYDRDSHSILGSLFLNPSVGAGVAFGSGGTQIRKGPSWTERALYCKVNSKGEVELVNTLGLKDFEDICDYLEKQEDSLPSSDLDPNCKAVASMPRYTENLRNLNGDVARCNADTTGLDCCRSEGKVMILATIHDSFPRPAKSKLVWVSCRDYATAHALKREVALRSEDSMAKSCEYMNRETYEGVDCAGRILIKMIELIGMQNLEPLWNLKMMIELIPLPFTNIICDKFLWWFNNIIPQPLPPAIRELGKEYDHHCLFEFAEYSDGEVDRLTAALDNFVASRPKGTVTYHACRDAFETNRATWFRFVVAPAFRTFAVGKGLQGLSIDYALPKNYTANPSFPEQEYPIENRWIYSHFGCNVYHEDLTFKPEINVDVGRFAIKHAVEDTGGKLPAEHGHGTEYPAPNNMQARWQKTDPLNVMNPGVGGTSPNKMYI